MNIYSQKELFKIRLYFTGIVTIAMCAFLAWDHYHGGVPVHHLFADETMPPISNWWGALLIPLLTWLLLYRIQKRLLRSENGDAVNTKSITHVAYGLAGFLLFGILHSVAFTFGYTDICLYMLLGLLPLTLFYPIYRAECLLGLILGMTYTYGPVIPVIVGSFVGVVSLMLYLYIRPAILFVISKFAFSKSLSK